MLETAAAAHGQGQGGGRIQPQGTSPAGAGQAAARFPLGARPNNLGFSDTTDFATYKNLRHYNRGVMKTTNFTGPKLGAVTYLTLDELKSVAAHWKVDIRLD